jgi:DNA-binding response OmpR family regulator
MLSKTRKMKVLVVDNETEFASTLAERLRLRKIKAESVYSGAEALAAIPRFLPDVIILDIQMPDMTGLEVLARVKAIDPTIEVILLTGHGSFEAGITGMELGAFDYIVKPVDLIQFMEKITEAYKKRLDG